MKKLSTVEKFPLFSKCIPSKNVPPSFQTLKPLIIKTFVQKNSFMFIIPSPNLTLLWLSNIFCYRFGKIKAEKPIKIDKIYLATDFVQKAAQIKVFEKY
jgi:hypothetical protein